MPVTRDQVSSALTTVPGIEVKDIRLDGDHVFTHLEIANLSDPPTDVIKHRVETALKSVGVESVEIQFTVKKISLPQAPRPGELLGQVKHIIAVGAGKGGVGKSTIAVNLAIGLQRTGATVGFMDGDIYGPSAPTMLGLRGASPILRNSKILPHYVHGLHAMSIGTLVEQDKPLIWRGPKAHGAFKQLLADDTDWPSLDYLVVDLPPGTGDVPLSLCQLLPLTGAIVVVTPQQVAVDDAIRAVRMFQQLGTSVLGVVENMAGELFGQGGGARMAQQLNLPLLATIPAVSSLRENSDNGTPTKNFSADTPLAAALNDLTQNVLSQVNNRAPRSAGPQLTIS